MYGMDWNDPMRIRGWHDLISWINEIGFLPLFKNEIEGFSVEEHTSNLFWWTGDPEQDPWEWRELIARSHEVAYGKLMPRRKNCIRAQRLRLLICLKWSAPIHYPEIMC